MIPFHQSSSKDKARLLHQLFPEHMPELIGFIEGICLTIIEDEKLLRARWQYKTIDFDQWLTLSQIIFARISQNREGLTVEPELFAQRLFSGDFAAFSTDCIQSYTQVRKHPDEKFTQAVDFFFNP